MTIGSGHVDYSEVFSLICLTLQEKTFSNDLEKYLCIFSQQAFEMNSI